MATGARKRKSAAERQKECRDRKRAMQQKKHKNNLFNNVGCTKNMLKIKEISVKTDNKYHIISMKKKKEIGNFIHQKKT